MHSIKNLKIFPIFEIFHRFSPHFLIAPLYYQSILGSYTLAMAVFSTTLISCSISEIPMGVLSDFIGRKKTIILASFFSLLSFLLFIFSGVSTNYFQLSCFSAAILLGVSQALFSGTVDALIYESVKENNQLNNYTRHYSRGKGLGAFSSAMSAFISGIITYYYSYIICFILSGMAAFFTLIISCFYQDIETKKDIVSYSKIKKHLKETCYSFKNNPKLFLLSLAKILGDNVSYRIDVIYFKSLIPEYLLGAPRMLKKVFECMSYLYAAFLINKLTSLKILIISNLWITGIRAVAITVNNFFSPFITSMVDLLDGTSSTAFSNLLQTEYNDEQRATTASIISMASTIWTSLLLIIMGTIIDYSSVRFALAILIAYRFIRFFIYYNIQKKYI